MILPAAGCRVRIGPDGDVGIVRAASADGSGVRVEVVRKGGRISTVPHADLEPQLVPGSEVVHVPPRTGAEGFGHGTVEQLRCIAGRHQVLVDFWRRGTRLWLPWEHLVPVPPLKHLFLKGQEAERGSAETFRLRNLSYALDQWHANTGALTRLEIDPLPHQIHLVHRILTSGDLNWMIADDVGLGKTIEVGLLLAALRAKGSERFLLVVPAGLTRQWKEEMRDKFGIADFMIYGDDVRIREPQEWKLFDRVIVSVDRLRMDVHLENFLRAERWDVVVFDEAHRLGREEYGRMRRSTDRFRAAAALRPHADAFLLLTGTPHQGRDDRFRALLELLRPGKEWRERFRRLREHPEVLGDIVVRNRKADVTDADGTFIFRGKDVRTVDVPTNDWAREFDRELRAYLRNGYAASAGSGPTGKAIGFVMTVYRKLAASSQAAIAKALERRLERLTREGAQGPTSAAAEDERFVEHEEVRVDAEAPASEFFRGEAEMLVDLVRKARILVEEDRKLEWFLDEIVAGLKRDDPDGKLLVFTEYRTTQEHLANALRERYGDEAVVLIHGSQTYEQRRAQIDAFDDRASFLISTEAGGEGLNLQRNCHVMANYDLPWNPMRLVQRVGRLYRYGQTKRVQVINLHAPDSLDQKVLGRMYDRLDSVAADMAAVGGEFAEGREGLQEDILGELVASLDFEELLAAGEFDEVRDEERLEAALKRAREATERQDEILRHASGYDPTDLARDLRLGREHLVAFAEGACEAFGVEVAARRYDGLVWDLRLPERLQERIGSRQNVRIAFDRSKAARLEAAEMFGPEHPLYRFFTEELRKYDPKGRTARLVGLDGTAALGALLRWTDDRGRPLYHEYVGAVLRSDGTVDVNPDDWGRFLLAPAPDGRSAVAGSREILASLKGALDEELHRRSTGRVHPDTPYFLGIATLSSRSDVGVTEPFHVPTRSRVDEMRTNEREDRRS